jgi:hypothetical protein
LGTTSRPHELRRLPGIGLTLLDEQVSQLLLLGRLELAKPDETVHSELQRFLAGAAEDRRPVGVLVRHLIADWIEAGKPDLRRPQPGVAA